MQTKLHGKAATISVDMLQDRLPVYNTQRCKVSTRRTQGEDPCGA